jgi:hypothetical protein
VHYHGRPRLVSASHFPYLIGNYNITQTDIYWSFGVTSNMQLGFFVNNAGTPALVYTPSNTVPNDTWVHIAMTYSNAPKTVTLYMNGLPMSNLTACNYSGTIFSVSNAWATSATGPGLTSILNTALYPGMGYLSLGRWGGSNPPCYIHDFKMVTGTCYAPSNQPPASASVTPGTRLLLRAAQISQTAYTKWLCRYSNE